MGCAQDMIEPLTGSKPGDPFGDIVFHFFMGQALSSLMRELRAKSLCLDIPCSAGRWCHPLTGPAEAVCLTDVSYVDDALFAALVAAEVAPLEATADLSAIVCTFFSDRCMRLIHKPGKTEATIAPFQTSPQGHSTATHRVLAPAAGAGPSRSRSASCSVL